MSGTAQLFPTVGSNVNIPNPLPTKDVSDGTPGSTAPTTAIQVAGTDGTDLRVIATDASGDVKVIGNLTNNNAAPAATEVGVLPALANASAPTWTEGQQVLESTDLSGNQRVVLKAETTKVIGTVNQGTSPWVVSGTVSGPTSSTANSPSQQTVTSSSGSILASNSSRKECTVVNTGTVPVYLGLGQVPTDTAYHIALSPCSTANDGTGGTYTSDVWLGVVNAIVTSTSGSVVVTELS